jgi:hypothetical protein
MFLCGVESVPRTLDYQVPVQWWLNRIRWVWLGIFALPVCVGLSGLCICWVVVVQARGPHTCSGQVSLGASGLRCYDDTCLTQLVDTSMLSDVFPCCSAVVAVLDVAGRACLHSMLAGLSGLWKYAGKGVDRHV